MAGVVDDDEVLDAVGNGKQIKIDRKTILGQGYFAKVFKGTFDSKKVAVKRMEIQDMNARKSTHYEKELKIIKASNHKNIVKYLYDDKDLDFFYLAMELCECSLCDYFERYGYGITRTVEVLFKILFHATSGVTYLHSKDIQHRDIKPRNLLISKSADGITVKLADFGICKIFDPTSTSKSSMSDTKGTYGYNAAEFCVKGKVKTKKSDIFSLGIVFHECAASGEHPFGEHGYPAQHKINEKEIPKISDTIQYTLRRLIEEMIEHIYDNRPDGEHVQLRLRGMAANVTLESPIKSSFFKWNRPGTTKSDNVTATASDGGRGGGKQGGQSSDQRPTTQYGIQGSQIKHMSMGGSYQTGDVYNMNTNVETSDTYSGPVYGQGAVGRDAFNAPVYNYTTVNQQVVMQQGQHNPEYAQQGQFGYQPHRGVGPPQQFQQPQNQEGPAGAPVQNPGSSPLQYPPPQSLVESHRSLRQFPPGQPLPRYVRKLTETITAFTDKPLSEKAHVYPGEQKMGGMLTARLTAVKVVRHTLKKMREAQNLVKLTPHVNVVSIYHADMLAGSFEPRIYIVMEKCNPETLECYIKKRKLAKIPFNPTQALEIARQIIDGMNHIHKNNIIHRDLKPGSVLFSLCGKFVKIIDFGMSKELKYGLSVMSLSTLPLGTDGYRAPETYNKDKINKQADIFSLGILLYHIWSNGCHPFGPGPDIWSYNIKNHIPPDFSDLLIPDAESAADLLTGMLKIDPEQRSTIDNVKDHPLIKQTVEDTVKKAVTLIWSGSIQQVSGECTETMQNCMLFQNKDGPPVEFDSFGWRLDMQHLPNFDRKKISMPTCKVPGGYLAMKKSCVKKLSEKLLEEKKMAWIDLYNDDDERIRSLMIIRPKGYDDVYGVMVTKPDEFMETILGVKPPEKETTPKEPGAEGMEQSETEESHSDDSTPVASTSGEGTFSQPGMSSEGTQAAGVGSQDTKDGESEEDERMTPVGATPSQRPWVTAQLEFIAWWHPEEGEAAAASSSRT